MLKFFFLVILILSFWNPVLASIIFIVSVSLFNLWLYSGQYLGRREPDASRWNSVEREAIKKYHLYFQFPFSSRVNSSIASGIYIFGLILAIWLLWNTLWLYAIIVIINSIASAIISPKLNPKFYLHEAVERQHKYQFRAEMMAVDSVCEKILEKQKEDRDHGFTRS